MCAPQDSEDGHGPGADPDLDDLDLLAMHSARVFVGFDGPGGFYEVACVNRSFVCLATSLLRAQVYGKVFERVDSAEQSATKEDGSDDDDSDEERKDKDDDDLPAYERAPRFGDASTPYDEGASSCSHPLV